jgi:hypothetical protein
MNHIAVSADVIFMPVHLWSGLQYVLGSMEIDAIYRPLILESNVKQANIASYICHGSMCLRTHCNGRLSARPSGQKRLSTVFLATQPPYHGRKLSELNKVDRLVWEKIEKIKIKIKIKITKCKTAHQKLQEMLLTK